MPYFEPEWDKATPRFEHSPERTYERKGAIVSCYLIPDSSKPEEREDSPIFTIHFDDEENAKKLIEDIYYGEYTGA